MSSSFLSSLPAAIHIGQSVLVVAGSSGDSQPKTTRGAAWALGYRPPEEFEKSFDSGASAHTPKWRDPKSLKCVVLRIAELATDDHRSRCQNKGFSRQRGPSTGVPISPSQQRGSPQQHIVHCAKVCPHFAVVAIRATD